MANPKFTLAPAGYVPEFAACFVDTDGSAAVAGVSSPLPVTQVINAATSTPLTGTATGTTQVGPFVPQPGRAIWLTLSDAWSGTATVLRSVDGGATVLPLTVGGQPWARFTANAQEPFGEETVTAATYHLSVVVTSGTLGYEVRQ